MNPYTYNTKKQEIEIWSIYIIQTRITQGCGHYIWDNVDVVFQKRFCRQTSVKSTIVLPNLDIDWTKHGGAVFQLLRF